MMMQARVMMPLFLSSALTDAYYDQATDVIIEKQMALRKELMRQNQIKYLLELRNKADNHYKIQLMKKCLCPWIEFTHTMKQTLVLAIQRHSVIMMTTVWRVWFVEYRDKVANKNSIADSFHGNTLLIRSIKQWKQFVVSERELMIYYRQRMNSFLLRRYFRSWELFVRSERILYWEKERKARKHHESLLDLQKRLIITKSALITCPKHNDPLRVYCETCRQVICRDCTISKEHNTHEYELVSECYPKHHQQIEDSLDLVKHKMADLNTAVTQLDTTEKKVIKKGEQLQKQINRHAQQIIDQVERSRERLSQQLHDIVNQNSQLLAAQKHQAQKLNTQLNTCQEMIEHSLKEWTQLQILTEKHKMINQMNTATQHVDPTMFQPIENADIKFTETNAFKNEIGFITSTTYKKATLNVLPCLAKQPSTAILTIHSQGGSPFSLPPSLISSTLYSPGDTHSVKCDITQTHQAGKYNITFTPTTRQDQLIVQVGGVDIPDSPFTLPVIPTPEMRGKPINIITGLNRPQGIAVCDNGDIVVAEWGAHCITTLNKEGKMVSFGKKGTKEGQFTCPQGVAITNDGCILVTDNHRLQKLTTDGVCVKSVGSSKSGSRRLQFNNPCGITVHPTTGQIFVADSENNRIQVFKNDLTFSHTITLSSNKQFDRPWDVSLDNEGYLHIAEFENDCITKLTAKGKYITRFGSARQLSIPTSLTINNGLVYVTEYGNNHVSVFDINGTFLHCFGKRGSGEGEFNVPCGITMDTTGNLYVSDKNNNRIIVY